jgi:hypothetical protein
MPTATTVTSPTALKPGTRMAPVNRRPAAPAKPSGSASNAVVLWAVWFGAAALMLIAALGR